MKRRAFLWLIVALPAAGGGLGQNRAGIPVVGFLGFASEEADRPTLDAFREGLKERGHVEGRTILVVARHAGGDLDRAAQLIDEMTRIPVDVFVAPGPAAARSIRRATQIPIVALGLPPSDPDLFRSLARPGGSVTGFSAPG